jgi:hypothetical protein
VDPLEKSTSTRSGGRRFAGLSTHLMVALFAASGGLLGAGLAAATERWSHHELARLFGDLESQQGAGLKAYEVLTEADVRAQAQAVSLRDISAALARARAQVLATEAAHSAPHTLKGGELVGHFEQGRAHGLEAAGIAAGATLAVARPDLAPLLKGEAVTTHDGHWSTAKGPRVGVGRAPIPTPVEPVDLGPALRLAGALAAPTAPPAPIASPVPVFLFAGVLAGLLAGLWFHLRYGAPIAAALQAARDFDHGQERARAEPDRGNREAREIALVVNALIERAERHQAQGRAARSQDVQGVARAIAGFGHGDLRGPTPTLAEPFEPLGEALEVARRDLIERINDLHHSAATTAQAAVGIGPSGKKIADAATDQRDALHHLGEGLLRAKEEALAAQDRLGEALAGLGRHGAEQRRVIQEARATLMAVGRRSSELAGLQSQTAELLQSSASLDQALTVLSRLVARRGDDGVDLPPARLTAMAGEGRAAFEALQRGLKTLEEELGTLGSTLEHTAQSQPELGGDPRTDLTAPLFDLASTLVRVAELTAGSLKALERAHRGMAEGATELLGGARQAQLALQNLGPALANVRVGGGFEEALLARLHQSLEEIRATEGRPEALTPDGQRLLAEVRLASEAARARLARLVEATETALSVLRS